MTEPTAGWIDDPSWELKDWSAGPYVDPAVNAAFWSQATDDQRSAALFALSEMILALRRAGIYPTRDKAPFPGIPRAGNPPH